MAKSHGQPGFGGRGIIVREDRSRRLDRRRPVVNVSSSPPRGRRRCVAFAAAARLRARGLMPRGLRLWPGVGGLSTSASSLAGSVRRQPREPACSCCAPAASFVLLGNVAFAAAARFRAWTLRGLQLWPGLGGLSTSASSLAGSVRRRKPRESACSCCAPPAFFILLGGGEPRSCQNRIYEAVLAQTRARTKAEAPRLPSLCSRVCSSCIHCSCVCSGRRALRRASRRPSVPSVVHMSTCRP